MEGNSLFITSDTVTVVYYDFRIMMVREWFATCNIKDFKKCMKTLKWCCTDDADKFCEIIACINTTLSLCSPHITREYDKKQKVLNKYRKEFPVYEF